MAAETDGTYLPQVVALLAASVVAVPIFRRAGLGSVLGYLAAGLVIGPFGLGLFSDPEAILHVAELGVVMFLFIIGLEMQPKRLWGLRREIFGLGLAQVALCGLFLTLVVDALLEVKRRVAPYIDLQLVAFPQDGYFRSPNAAKNLELALDKGVDIVGGIPHFERTMADGAASVKALCEIAEKRGLLVDMHCDETDDPLSRQIETLAAETVRLGLEGRVAGSHLTSMHSMDNYYVSKLLPLIAEAGIHAIPNPLINIVLQGRHDTYPKRRGMTRVPEMRGHGINVAFGQDCCMDPWYSLGGADMLDVAHMGLHVAQLTSREAMRFCFEAVTVNAAHAMHLDGYGIAVGANADMVVLQARDPIEAIRLRARRTFVIRRGKVIAETAAETVALALDGRPEMLDPASYFPHPG